MLDLGGGTGALNYFVSKGRYEKDILSFNHCPLKFPVIIIIDNDDGAKNLFKTLSKDYGIKIEIQSSDAFFHITQNLYLVKTPERGATGTSCIEDFFDTSLLATQIQGKNFNPNKDHGVENEYGKFIFAERVVRSNASKINFNDFAPLLQRIVAVINHYKPKQV